LGNCGEANIEEEIEQYLSPECLNGLDQLVEDGYDILEHDKNIPYVLEHIGKFLKDIENTIDLCHIPTKKNFFLKAEETTPFKFEFNLEECLKQSEQVSILFEDFENAWAGKNGPKIITSFFNLADEILYNWIDACAGSNAEDEIEHYFPEACADAVENFSILVDDVVEHGKDIKYILESLPEFYSDVIAIKDKCPSVGLFVE